jgi:hypothetical protein
VENGKLNLRAVVPLEVFFNCFYLPVNQNDFSAPILRHLRQNKIRRRLRWVIRSDLVFHTIWVADSRGEPQLGAFNRWRNLRLMARTGSRGHTCAI